MTEKTPLPWVQWEHRGRDGERVFIGPPDEPIISLGPLENWGEKDHEYALFILKALNAHNDLMAALQAVEFGGQRNTSTHRTGVAKLGYSNTHTKTCQLAAALAKGGQA